MLLTIILFDLLESFISMCTHVKLAVLSMSYENSQCIGNSI